MFWNFPRVPESLSPLIILVYLMMTWLSEKWYFVTKIVPSFCENCFWKFSAFSLEFQEFFSITGTIFSNSERSEKFLVTECFFNLFLEVSPIQKIRTIRFQIGKKLLGLRNMQENLVISTVHVVSCPTCTKKSWMVFNI